MALTNININIVADNLWNSDEFEPTTSNIAVGVKFSEYVDDAGVNVLMSIDGVNWTLAGNVKHWTVKTANDYYLKGVCGFVVGTKFKVECTKEPLFIHVLE